MINLFSKTKIPILEKALKAYSLRQKAIASNIANATTPGYKSLEVKFEEELTKSMDNLRLENTVTDEKHLKFGKNLISEVEPEIKESEESDDPLASGYNNVNIEKEMVDLAQNQIQYRMASRLMKKTFEGIQNAIKGQAQ
jgi:flagellar basal-body rod protein FlgB